jgi:putative lipoic acid-binding regulatory protein
LPDICAVGALHGAGSDGPFGAGSRRYESEAICGNMGTDEMNERRESTMEFPCQFPIKVMGYWAEDFDALVAQIVRRHVGDLGEGALRSRESRGGRFISVTVTIEAKSRTQLDAIYRDLTSETRVVMVL